MTLGNAFARLFPACLFSIMMPFLSILWRADVVLMALGFCAAAVAWSWLIVTIVEVARGMETRGSTTLAARAPSAQ
jgi:hypothetical protein